MIGADTVGRYEHVIVEWVKRAIPFQWPEEWGGESRLTKPLEKGEEAVEAYDHGVREAEELNQGANASKCGAHGCLGEVMEDPHRDGSPSAKVGGALC